MIPILYGGDEVNFTSNGLGRLRDAVSCIVTEERNGIFELELAYPVTGVHFDDIQIGTIIYTTHDASGTPQPFDVYKRSAEIDGMVTFFAHHISYRLNTIVCMPFSVTSSTVSNTFTNIKNHAASTVPFYFYTDKTNSENYYLRKPNTIRQMLGGEENSILDVYGTGEYKFDKWNVTLYVNRGTDRGVSVRYGKNMTALQEERSVEGRYSAAVPFWLSEETGEMVTLPEIAVVASSLPTEHALWTNENDVIMRDNNGNEFEFNYPIVEYIAMDLSDEWEEPPTVSQLRNKAQSRLDNSEAWLTDENLSVDFTTEGLPEELNHILLCDTVGVYFPALGVEVKKKVIKTEYNSLLECYENIELGNPKTSLFSAIEERTEEILTSYVRRSYMEAAIDNATNLITGATGGHVVFGLNADGQPEEIMVMDSPSTATAVNVIRINKNGIGFSTTGYDGAYTTAWTIDGNFVADFITTGNLNADLITTGNLNADLITSGMLASQDGETSFNLDTGELISYSGIRSVRIRGGYIYLVDRSYDNDFVGMISTSRWDNDAQKTGFTMLTHGKYLGLGIQPSDSGAYSVLVVNNGLNPYGGITDELLAVTNTGIVGSNLSFYETNGTKNGTIQKANATYGGVNPFNAFNIRTDAGTAALLLSIQGTYYYLLNGGANPDSRTERHLFWGDAYFYNNINCYVLTMRSDEKLKNVEKWNNGYDDALDDLEPICFRWKDNNDKLLHVGLGARKTAKVLEKHGLEDSGMVVKDEAGGYSINYAELTVMLLKRVQEQEKRIADLERRLAECR